MIDYSNFYRWEDPLHSRSVRLRLASVNSLGFGDDFINNAHLISRADNLPDTPLALMPDSGNSWEHILWTTTGILLLISQHVQDLFSESGLRGWSTFPVEVYDRNKTRIPGYSGLSITGRVGNLDVYRGEIVLKPPHAPGGRSYEVLKGFFFENDFWDGSDICFAGESGNIIVVKRTVELCTKAKIKNVRFTPVLKVEKDITMLKIVGQWRSQTTS